jgi:glycosyltransferase involved in cell wall biosynthesis
MNNKLQNLFSLITKEFKSSAKIIFRPPIENYYKTNYPRNALVSYITNPFRKETDLSHTNLYETLEIGLALNNAGFNVDIADYDYTGIIDYSRYDFIIGFGEPLINSFYNRRRRIVTVYYGTGMHINTQNNNSLNRINEVFNKKGVFLPGSGRIVDKAWSIQTTLVDAMILLGNLEVTKTYSHYFNGKIYNIPAMFLKCTDYNYIISSKIFDQAKKHFLWFGSSGLIHKGLDLLLEVFSKREDIHLHICGPLDNEPEFQLTYCGELKKANIFYHGFVSLDSDLFKELLQKCAFVIFPSCSEGGSPSVVNVCGNGGLIPLLSKEASIDIADFGFIFEKVNLVSIQSVIDFVIKMDSKELLEKSLICGKTISTINSRSNYSILLRKYINEIAGGISIAL